jgi:antitoxin VapB
MSLNIKNERTHALVRELAEITGQTQTSAVEDAVRRRLEEVRASEGSDPQRAARRVAIDRIGRAFHADTTPEERAGMHDHDWLYDDRGLPA